MSKKPIAIVPRPLPEAEVFTDDERFERRTSPGMRAFEGASMGGPERYTEEQISFIVAHADEFVAALGKALDGYVPLATTAEGNGETADATGAEVAARPRRVGR